MTTWKTSAEIREAPDRCRIAGCRVPMSPSGHPGTCGNHEIDKPRRPVIHAHILGEHDDQEDPDCPRCKLMRATR